MTTSPLRSLQFRFLLPFLFLAGLAQPDHARAQEKALEPAASDCSAKLLCLETLVHLSRAELEDLYCHGQAVPCLDGCYRGVSIRWAGTCVAGLDSKITGCLWKGKHFESCGGALVNEWGCGIEAVHAHVFCGDSWMDGKPALIMDYRGMSPIVWRKARDELREIAPGLYLGVMFKESCGQPKFVRFFALECKSK